MNLLHLEKSVRAKWIFLAALLALTTLLIYAQVLHHDFIQGLDDDAYITENIHIRSGFSIPNIYWAFRSLEPFYWHPLTWFSHMLDVQLFGLNAGAHHYMNVAIHTANALLLFWLLYRSTGMLWRSFVAAALFALHPLNIETVAWAAERKSVLGLFFSLLTVAAYGWHVKLPGWRRYVTVAAVFILALMCKPAAATLPIVLLLLDYWPLNRGNTLRWGRLAFEKLPLLLIAIGASSLSLLGQRSGDFMVPLSVLPMLTRVETAVLSYVTYLAKSLWPSNLSAFHPHPASALGPSLPLGDVIASAIILIVISVAVLYLRRERYLVLGWSLFIFTMIPMIGIIQLGFQGVQDHFMYIPGIGLIIAATWGIAAIIEGFSIPRPVLAATSIVLIGSYAAATYQHLKYWENGVTLFGQARSVLEQPNPWIEQLYANALKFSGRVDEALQHYKTSCILGPRNEYCHYEIAEILLDRGQLQDAAVEFQTALMLTRKKDIALLCLNGIAEAFVRSGEFDSAEQFVQEALKIDPNNATTAHLREQIFLSRSKELH